MYGRTAAALRGSRDQKTSNRRRGWLALVAVSGLALAAGGPAVAADRSVTCPISVTIPRLTWSALYPTLRSGDAEFAGHGPAVTVAAKRSRVRTVSPAGTTDSLVMTLSMRAEETSGDRTTATGSRTYTLYTARSGCFIDTGKLTYGSFDSNGYLDRMGRANPQFLGAGDSATLNDSFVEKYTVRDDRAGADVGPYTSVQVTTRAFTIRFTS